MQLQYLLEIFLRTSNYDILMYTNTSIHIIKRYPHTISWILSLGYPLISFYILGIYCVSVVQLVLSYQYISREVYSMLWLQRLANILKYPMILLYPLTQQRGGNCILLVLIPHCTQYLVHSIHFVRKCFRHLRCLVQAPQTTAATGGQELRLAHSENPSG